MQRQLVQRLLYIDEGHTALDIFRFAVFFGVIFIFVAVFIGICTVQRATAPKSGVEIFGCLVLSLAKACEVYRMLLIEGLTYLEFMAKAACEVLEVKIKEEDMPIK